MDPPRPPQGWQWVGSGGTGWHFAPHEYQVGPAGGGPGGLGAEDAACEITKAMDALATKPDVPLERFCVVVGNYPPTPLDASLFSNE